MACEAEFKHRGVLVVSDGTLWAAGYAEDGSRQGDPHQELSVEHYIAREYHGPGQHKYTVSHLHIVTKSALPALLLGLSKAPAFDALFLPTKMPPEFPPRVA